MTNPKELDRHETGVSARLDDETIARIDALAVRLTSLASGVPVRRAAVVKRAMLLGLEALEKQAAKK